MRVHLDTDFGGDPDDACALVMLLGWPGVELVGVTTNLEVDGRRSGCVAHYLAMAGREDVPVAAGAGRSLTTLQQHELTWGDRRYWPTPVAPRPGPPGAALNLLMASIEDGATVVAIGALTNLAFLETLRRGALAGAQIVAMGGWVDPPADGLPQWGPERDWNIQCDTRAAEIVAGAADLTLVTLPATLRAHLRRRDLPRLRAAGAIGELLALQTETHAIDSGKGSLGAVHDGLPDDLLNFQYDPVTCAIAVGWDGAETVERRLRTEVVGDMLHWRDDPAGRPANVVTEVDGDAFATAWIEAVERACDQARMA